MIYLYAILIGLEAHFDLFGCDLDFFGGASWFISMRSCFIWRRILVYLVAILIYLEADLDLFGGDLDLVGGIS